MTQTPTDAELMTFANRLHAIASRCRDVAVARGHESRAAKIIGADATTLDEIGTALGNQARALKDRLAQGEAKVCDHTWVPSVERGISHYCLHCGDVKRASPTTPSQARDELTRIPPMEFMERAMPKAAPTPPCPQAFGRERCLWLIDKASALYDKLNALVTPSADEYEAATKAINQHCRDFWPELSSYIRSIEAPVQAGKIERVVVDTLVLSARINGTFNWEAHARAAIAAMDTRSEPGTAKGMPTRVALSKWLEERYYHDVEEHAVSILAIRDADALLAFLGEV